MDVLSDKLELDSDKVSFGSFDEKGGVPLVVLAPLF